MWEDMILEFYIWLFHNLLAGTIFEISIFLIIEIKCRRMKMLWGRVPGTLEETAACIQVSLLFWRAMSLITYILNVYGLRLWREEIFGLISSYFEGFLMISKCLIIFYLRIKRNSKRFMLSYELQSKVVLSKCQTIE